jgi:hypothetical protein
MVIGDSVNSALIRWKGVPKVIFDFISLTLVDNNRFYD